MSQVSETLNAVAVRLSRRGFCATRGGGGRSQDLELEDGNFGAAGGTGRWLAVSSVRAGIESGGGGRAGSARIVGTLRS